MKFKKTIGETPLHDYSGLIPKHILTQEELNEWEQENVLKATQKFLIGPRTRKSGWLNAGFIKKVHFEMFKETWQWAGEFRTSNLNIGVPWHQISIEIKKLCDDFNVWKKNSTDQLILNAVTLHHRLTWIHPFANGNGRHARLMANLLLYYEKNPILSWGKCPLNKRETARKKYLAALKEADRGNITPLIEFAKSGNE